jgi:hypothetical protein
MPCMEMKELEVSCTRYDERRLTSKLPNSERRKRASGKRRTGQAEMAYIMRVHLQTCLECRREI